MRLTKGKFILGGLLACVLVGGAFAAWQYSPQKRFARHITKARISTNNGQLGPALIQYEEALKIDPTNDLAMCEIGYVRLAMEQPDLAEERFEACLKEHPKYARAWTGLVRARILKEDLAGAAEAAQGMLELDRGADSLVAHGDVLNAKGEFDKAVGVYREAQQDAPKEYEPLQRTVSLLQKLKRSDEARRELIAYADRDGAKDRDRALGLLAEEALQEERFNDALGFLDRACELSKEPMLEMRRAAVLVALKDWTRARESIDRVFVAVPEPVPQAHTIRATIALQENNLDQAWQDVQVAGRSLPDDYQLALLHAQIHFKAGRIQQAEVEAQRAISIAPSYAPTQNFLMALYLKDTRYTDAIALGKEIATRTRGSEASLRLLARAYMAAGKADEAKRVFEQLRAPKPVVAAAPRAVVAKAGVETPEQILERVGNLEKSERESATTQFLLGNAYFAQRNIQNAIAAYEKAIAADPNRPEIQLALGTLRSNLGQPDLAAERFEAVLAKDPTSLRALETLAQIRTQQGKHKEAAELYERLLFADGRSLQALAGLVKARVALKDADGLAAIAKKLEGDASTERQALGFVAQAAVKTVNNDAAGAAPLLDKALELAPTLTPVMHARAVIHINKGEGEKAAALLRRSAEIQPAQSRTERLDTAAALLLSNQIPEARGLAMEEHLVSRQPETLVLLIAAALKSDTVQQAKDVLADMGGEAEATGLQRLVDEKNAGEIFMKLMLADVFARSNHGVWALEQIDAAVALAPANIDILAFKANAMARTGKVEEGAAILADLVQKNPKRADIILTLAEIRRGQEKNKEAIALFKQAQALLPKHEKLPQILGTLLLHEGEHAEAAKFLKLALAKAPNDLVSINNYAWVMAVELKAPQDALPYATTLLRLAPNNASVLDTAGWVLYLNADYAGALKALSYAAVLAGDQPQVAFHHAMALFKSGQRVEALTELKRARALHADLKRDFPSLKEAERMISELEATAATR